MGGVLAERVEELRSDHSHGGSWMARRAVEALAELASESAESSAKLLERLDVAGHELAATRREMGAIAGAVGRVLAAAHHGAHLAPEDLRSSGLDVELVDDADAEQALERASLFLVGADTVFRDGAVCNKVGTFPLAEAATRLGVRTVVACEVIKLAPVDAPRRIDDEHFDLTQPEDVDEIVTEEGSYPSDDVRTLIDRTPFLSEGYALLAAG